MFTRDGLSAYSPPVASASKKMMMSERMDMSMRSGKIA